MTQSRPPISAQIADLLPVAAKVNRNHAYNAVGLCLRSLQTVIKVGRYEKADAMTDSLSADQFLELLRGATEDDIDAALEGALFDMPINNTAEALELFNRVLDVMTGHADQAHAMDAARIASAATHKAGSD